MTDLSAEAKRLFERARAEFEPTATQMAALDDAIAARIAAGGGPASSGQGSGNAGGGSAGGGWPAGWVGSSVVAKAIGAGVLIGLAVLGLAYRSSSGPMGRTSPGVGVASSSVVAAPKPSAVRRERRISGVPSVPFGDLPSAAVGPRPPSAKAPAAPPRVAADVGSSDPSVLHPATDPSPPEVADAVAPSLRASLTDELRLVRGAHAALDRGDAEGALAITEEHDARYPRGTLREENLALKVRALCALGRSTAARSAALALVRTAPDSPYRAGLRASCVGPRFDE